VSQVGTKEYSEMFGIEPLPKFLFGTMDMHTKIKKFNQYIYDRVKSDDSEAVIIGIPGGIVQTTPFIFEEFGEMAYIISNAIRADVCILNVYAQELSEEYLDSLLDICKYKFNFPVEYINVSNTHLHISPEDKGFKYITVTSEYVTTNVINTFDYEKAHLFNCLDKKSSQAAYEKILTELTDNI